MNLKLRFGLNIGIKTGAMGVIESQVAEVTRLDSLLIAFNGGGDEVGIYRLDVGANSAYWLCQHIGNARYWCTQLLSSTIDTKTLHALYKSKIQSPFLALDQTSAAFTYAGTWTHNISQAGTYGGTYSRTTVATSTATVVTPASVYRVALRGMSASNAGVCKVSIDGDPTRANLLSTAQDLVTAGTLPDTVLIANGGTLNPTDRVIDQYSAVLTADTVVRLADDLSAEAHTIVLTCTGYKRAASSDTRLYLSGLDYCATTTRMSAVGAIMRDVNISINNNVSAWEYALGVNGAVLCGGLHGYEGQTALTIAVDSVETVLENNQSATGGELTVVRTTQLFSAGVDAGATQIADVSTTYTLNPTTGLNINAVFDWLVNASITQAFAAMMPVDDTYDKGGNISTSDVTLLDNDDSIKAQGAGNLLMAWDIDGYYGAAVYVYDENGTLLNWLNSSDFAYIQDRTAGFNKMYFSRVDAPATESVAVGGQWVLESFRKVGYFSTGANAILAL